MSEYLLLAEAAEEVNIHYQMLWRWIACGRMGATRRGRSWFVSRAELERATTRATPGELWRERCYNLWRRVRRDARGVIPEWYHSFEAFFEDVTEDVGPAPEGSLLTIKRDALGFSLGNLLWVNHGDHTRSHHTPRRTRPLTHEKAEQMRTLRSQGARVQDIAKQFGVSRQMASMVLNLRSWRPQ